MRTSILLWASSSLFLATPAFTAEAACDPSVIASPTHFPLQSRQRGQEGVVLFEVTVDEAGRVAAARVLESSGHDRLDRAASASIRNGWRFNVTGCDRSDLPASDLISVEYRYDQAEK